MPFRGERNTTVPSYIHDSLGRLARLEERFTEVSTDKQRILHLPPDHALSGIDINGLRKIRNGIKNEYSVSALQSSANRDQFPEEYILNNWPTHLGDYSFSIFLLSLFLVYGKRRLTDRINKIHFLQSIKTRMGRRSK